MINAEAIKAARKRLNLTQDQLAEAMGVEQPTVQRWENGKRAPDESQIPALAQALQVEPADLMDASILDALHLRPVGEPANLPAEVAPIWSRMNSRQRQQMIRIAKAIVEEAG